LATFRTVPSHDGSPHIEQNGDTYEFVVTERGSEFERQSTKSEDEILYWLFSSITHQMAVDYELHHRIEEQDCRIIYFPKHVELLQILNAEWARKQARQYKTILGSQYTGLYS
jgi:superfamily II helicase